VKADIFPQLIGPLHRDRFRSNENKLIQQKNFCALSFRADGLGSKGRAVGAPPIPVNGFLALFSSLPLFIRIVFADCFVYDEKVIFSSARAQDFTIAPRQAVFLTLTSKTVLSLSNKFVKGGNASDGILRILLGESAG